MSRPPPPHTHTHLFLALLKKGERTRKRWGYAIAFKVGSQWDVTSAKLT